MSIRSPASPQSGTPGRLHLLRTVLVQHGWISIVLGYAVLTLFAPGGDDGYQFYLKPWWPDATAPSWVFLLTAPANPLSWPLRWTALVVFSSLAALWAQRAVGEKRWWIVLLNHAFVINIWLGQIEIVTMIGIALAWLVMERKWHPAWFGIAILCLLTKVQVGVGLIALFTFWMYTEQGIRPFVWGGLTAGLGVGVTLLLYPGWIGDYLNALRTLAPQDQWWNAAIFPYGLIALPFMFIPWNVGKLRRARIVACVTLLASPYFAWYHASTPMLLETRGAMTWLSWLDAVPRLIFNYKRMGWVVPSLMLAWDVWQIWSERRTAQAEAEKP